MSESWQALAEKICGRWSGSCRTWFEPEILADESDVTGDFEQIVGGRFLRHTYQGEIQGKPRTGEECIVYNRLADVVEATWIDLFHMNYGILFSRGALGQGSFSVLGHYDVGGENPRWGWRTTYDLRDNKHLVITAYNISPEGEEAKALETNYFRCEE